MKHTKKQTTLASLTARLPTRIPYPIQCPSRARWITPLLMAASFAAGLAVARLRMVEALEAEKLNIALHKAQDKLRQELEQLRQKHSGAQQESIVEPDPTDPDLA